MVTVATNGGSVGFLREGSVGETPVRELFIEHSGSSCGTLPSRELQQGCGLCASELGWSTLVTAGT